MQLKCNWEPVWLRVKFLLKPWTDLIPTLVENTNWHIRIKPCRICICSPWFLACCCSDWFLLPFVNFYVHIFIILVCFLFVYITLVGILNYETTNLNSLTKRKHSKNAKVMMVDNQWCSQPWTNGGNEQHLSMACAYKTADKLIAYVMCD